MPKISGLIEHQQAYRDRISEQIRMVKKWKADQKAEAEFLAQVREAANAYLKSHAGVDLDSTPHGTARLKDQSVWGPSPDVVFECHQSNRWDLSPIAVFRVPKSVIFTN